MAFVYVSERERWRTAMLLLWKRGPLAADVPGGRGRPIVRLIAEFASPEWPTQPLRKLTLSLIKTYTGINNSYYRAKKKWQSSQEKTQPHSGNFSWSEQTQANLVLNSRYELQNQIGAGAFGVVMKATDLQTGEPVAIKIIKAKKAYSQQARREIRLLQDLRASDVDQSSNLVELRGHFVYDNPGVGKHECLVFEMLSSNLYQLLEQVNFHGFSLVLVRKFTESLLRSLAFLASPEVRVIHTDIKPENICIRNPRRSALKLIDFGSSCAEGRQLFSYIQSRYYRSPEVLFGCPYTVSIDVWSLACVLVEMHIGSPLFSGDNAIDQIRKIMALNGMPPDFMIDTLAPEKRKELFKEGSWHATGQGAKWLPKEPVGTKDLDLILGTNTRGPQGKFRANPGHDPADYRSFKDLIARMLHYEPAKRLRPADALNHPFVTQEEFLGSTAPPSSSSRQSSGSSSAPDASASSASSASASSSTASDAGVAGGGKRWELVQLKTVLHEVGCPMSELSKLLDVFPNDRELEKTSLFPLADGIVRVLEAFTHLPPGVVEEAKGRFVDFSYQILRGRRAKALKQFCDYLRDVSAEAASEAASGQGAGSQLGASANHDTGDAASTPIP